jgi:hypothetical protein
MPENKHAFSRNNIPTSGPEIVNAGENRISNPWHKSNCRLAFLHSLDKGKTPPN